MGQKPLNEWFISHSTFISSMLSTTNYSSNVILISLPLTFLLFIEHYNYFYFVFFQRGAISGIAKFFKIWKDPKTDTTMYRKDMLINWTSTHLSYCAWYLDYLKGNAPTSKVKIWEKHQPIFLQGLVALEKETLNKKRLQGGKRRGKRQVQEFGSKMQDKENVPT